MGWLVTVVLALHFGYLAYVVLGGFLAWRWPKAIWPHVVACVWGVLILLGLVNCPLTWMEAWARRMAGQGPLTAGFVDRYLDNVIYPDRYVNLVRLAVVLVVAASWVGAYVTWRRRRDSEGRSRRRDSEGRSRRRDSEGRSRGGDRLIGKPADTKAK